MMLDCGECKFDHSCCHNSQECREHGGGEVDIENIPASRRARAEHVLMESGIARKDIASVLQELGYALFNVNLYPEFSEIREVPQDDMFILDYFGQPYDQTVYRDGVICKCRETIMFRNRKPFESVSVTCPRCGFKIAYG